MCALKYLNQTAIIFAAILGTVCIATATPVELKKINDDDYRVMAGHKVLAEVVPDANMGNMGILSVKNTMLCGVNWPHFLLYSQGKWLTDKVESEGFKLLEFTPLKTSGPLVGYSGKWQFRDYCISSECHFTWYDETNATQFHLVKARLEILKDLPDISSAWVEFMTAENSYTTVAAKTRGGQIMTMDVSKTGKDANMHYLDGYELATDGWITIYGARKGQGTCVAMVPIGEHSDILRPRINNGHVDNIEIHALDARKQNFLKQGRVFTIEYLLIVGPDQKDWKWIDAAVQRARIFMAKNADSLNCP
jgi:hypothetical protein